MFWILLHVKKIKLTHLFSFIFHLSYVFGEVWYTPLVMNEKLKKNDDFDKIDLHFLEI